MRNRQFNQIVGNQFTNHFQRWLSSLFRFHRFILGISNWYIYLDWKLLLREKKSWISFFRSHSCLRAITPRIFRFVLALVNGNLIAVENFWIASSGSRLFSLAAVTRIATIHSRLWSLMQSRTLFVSPKYDLSAAELWLKVAPALQRHKKSN